MKKVREIAEQKAPSAYVVSTTTSDDFLPAPSKPRKMTLNEAREAVEEQGKIASISIPVGQVRMIHKVHKDELGFLYEKVMFHCRAGAAPDGEERYTQWKDVLVNVPHAGDEEWIVLSAK